MELLGFMGRVVLWDPLLGTIHQNQRMFSAEEWRMLHEDAIEGWPSIETYVAWKLIVDIVEAVREQGGSAHERGIWSGVWTALVSNNGERGEIALDDLASLLVT